MHRTRRTPWVAIAVTSAMAMVLVSSMGEEGVRLFGGTTSLLLLAVIAVVSVAVLALRREHVDHTHFVAPNWAPMLGALLCGYLSIPVVSGRSAIDNYLAIPLIGAGIGLWWLNRRYSRRKAANSPALR